MKRGWCGLLPWLVALSMLLVAAGCNTGIAEREAQKRVRERLPELIGPAASYDVSVRSSSDMAVVGGRVRELRITGRRVQIAHQWPVDELLVVADKVDVNMQRQTLDKIGSARFQVWLRPETLLGYLQNDSENLRDVDIILDHGKLTITGHYRVVRLWTPFRVSGTLDLVDKHRIGFHTNRASAAGVPVPDVIVRYLEKRLNPVLDVTHTVMPIELTAVLIRPDAVVVTGIPRLDDPALLNKPLP